MRKTNIRKLSREKYIFIKILDLFQNLSKGQSSLCAWLIDFVFPLDSCVHSVPSYVFSPSSHWVSKAATTVEDRRSQVCSRSVRAAAAQPVTSPFLALKMEAFPSQASIWFTHKKISLHYKTEKEAVGASQHFKKYGFSSTRDSMVIITKGVGYHLWGEYYVDIIHNISICYALPWMVNPD